VTGEPQILTAARVFDGARMLTDHAIVVCDGRIVDVLPRAQLAASVATLPRPDSLIAPGFVDAQTNGGGGVQLNDDPSPAAVATIAAAHRRFGTTAFLPTLISDEIAVLESLAEAAPDILKIDGVLGFHLEGPWLNPGKRGIHPAAHIRPVDARTRAALLRFAAHGRSLVTLAPEAVPAGTIAELTGAGLRVAAGHTLADSATMARAAAEGLTGVTHLFNAMAPIAARAPGVPGFAFDDRRIFAGIICDGQHVDALALRMAYRLMGPERLFLVTDAMASLGSGRADFTLGGVPVRLENGKLLGPDGTLAGAHLDMASAMRNAMAAMGAPLEAALAMASATPARFLGVAHDHGRIARGFVAAFVHLDARLDPVAHDPRPPIAGSRG
jgi:N-acetylglucosamine-6-phosphate deacetylase